MLVIIIVQALFFYLPTNKIRVEQGPVFPEPINDVHDISKLKSASTVPEVLSYVFDAIRVTTDKLNNRIPLIGFAGAPVSTPGKYFCVIF